MHALSRSLAIAGFLTTTATGLAAHATNASVEEALKSRPELSSFYQGLVSTGVINELNSGVPYTIFAPTNEAFNKLTQEKYPCFYSEQCKSEVADILRNHIVPQEVAVQGRHGGGAFSIDKSYIVIGEPWRNSYTAAGHNITSTWQRAGGVLYEIDGVIANPQELASVSQMKYVMAPPVIGTTESITTNNGVVTQQSVTQQTYYPSYSPASGGANYNASQPVTSTTTYTNPNGYAPAPAVPYGAPTTAVPPAAPIAPMQ